VNKHNYIPVDQPSKVEYALLALLEMASQPNPKNPLTVSEITAKQPIPERYLEQIFATLRRGGLLKSHRGAKGGYVLAKDSHNITIGEIVSLIDGKKKLSSTAETTTPELDIIREEWEKANLAALSIFEKYSLYDLCKQKETYNYESLMYYI
jgi:Rrf2 family protein